MNKCTMKAQQQPPETGGVEAKSDMEIIGFEFGDIRDTTVVARRAKQSAGFET